MPIQTVSQSLANEGITYGFKNKFINGDMRVNQRATDYSGISTNGQYTTDRWSVEFGGLSSSTYNAAHSTDAPPGFAYSLSVTVAAASTGETSTSYFDIRQGFEVQNLDDFGWGTSGAKPVTISFWVKNSTTNPFSAGVRCGVNGGTFAFFKSFTVNAINTWEKKTFTITAPTQFTSGFTNSKNGYALDFNVGLWTSVGGAFATDGQWSTGNLLGTANSNTFVRTVGANIKITGLQMEVGSNATTFEYRNYGTELQMCKRYYEQWDAGSAYCPIPTAHIISGPAWTLSAVPRVQKRTVPTVSLSNSSGSSMFSSYGTNASGAGFLWSGSLVVDTASSGNMGIQIDSTLSGTGAGSPGSSVHNILRANQWIRFSAEI
jgi:hypothetical protein